MSEVIEDFIRRNPDLPEADAFESFLRMERISTWVGGDASRRERLRKEFSRVWTVMHPVVVAKSAPTLEPPRARPGGTGPAGPSTPPAPPRPSARVPTESPRRLHLLCGTCSRMEVFQTGEQIECRHCGHVYEDLLDLIPVRPVGPFAFLFGEGTVGWLTAAGIGGALIGLYLALRWLRWG